VARINGERLHYNHKFILVFEELSRLSGCSNLAGDSIKRSLLYTSDNYEIEYFSFEKSTNIIKRQLIIGGKERQIEEKLTKSTVRDVGEVSSSP